jgi:Flp pilus assembly protein TadG
MQTTIRPRFARRRRDGRPRSRGQAVVEFALILPVFLLFTLGVVDMARVFTSYISLTNGVANAALYASQGTNYLKWCAAGSSIAGAACTTSARNSANPDNIAYQLQVETTGLTLSSVTLSSPLCDGVACSALTGYTNVQIVGTYQMSLLIPLMQNLMGGPITMTAATTAAILQ